MTDGDGDRLRSGDASSAGGDSEEEYILSLAMWANPAEPPTMAETLQAKADARMKVLNLKHVRLDIAERKIELLSKIEFQGSKHLEGVDAFKDPPLAAAVLYEVSVAFRTCNEVLQEEALDEYDLAVQGHTSASINGEAESLMISSMRSDKCARFLTRNILEQDPEFETRQACTIDDLIWSRGFGSKFPLAGFDDGGNYEENRRVEIHLITPDMEQYHRTRLEWLRKVEQAKRRRRLRAMMGAGGWVMTHKMKVPLAVLQVAKAEYRRKLGYECESDLAALHVLRRGLDEHFEKQRMLLKNPFAFGFDTRTLPAAVLQAGASFKVSQDELLNNQDTAEAAAANASLASTSGGANAQLEHLAPKEKETQARLLRFRDKLENYTGSVDGRYFYPLPSQVFRCGRLLMQHVDSVTQRNRTVPTDAESAALLLEYLREAEKRGRSKLKYEIEHKLVQPETKNQKARYLDFRKPKEEQEEMKRKKGEAPPPVELPTVFDLARMPALVLEAAMSLDHDLDDFGDYSKLAQAEMAKMKQRLEEPKHAKLPKACLKQGRDLLFDFETKVAKVSEVEDTLLACPSLS